jgi:hypothetical protein
MTEERFLELIDPVLRALGASPVDGEEYRTPPLDVYRYYRRPTRTSRLPWLGRGLSVVAVARQPVDVPSSEAGFRTLLGRLAMAANGRFPPSLRDGLTLGLTAVVLTSEPIAPEDESTLAKVVDGRPLPRQRAVPLGLIRLNLGQEAVAFALASGPPGVFPEPTALADALTPHFRRFVPLLNW